MKKLKQLKNISLLLILLAIGVSSIAPVLANSLITIEIDNTLRQRGIEISGRSLKVWKISEEKISGDLRDKLSKFEKYSDEYLNLNYKEYFVTDVSDNFGRIYLDLKDGTYYVREIGDNKIIIPFFILVPMDESKVYPKIRIPYNPADIPPEIPDKPKDKINFRKVSRSENINLSGARFKVSKKVDGYFKDVYADGKVLIFESGKDGKFEVYLPKGTYYLSEIVPPKGYRPLSESIKFVIDDNSKDIEIIVNNDREPEIIPEVVKPNTTPNMPNMPKTGDITLIVMVISGVLLSFMGIRLIKE